MDHVRLTEGELLDYSGEHVAYEAQMFLCSYHFVFSAIDWNLSAPTPVPKNLRKWTVEMALLEAVVAHARVLLNFLYPSFTRADDVIAGDFFDEAEQWEKIRPKLSERLKTMRQRASKELAHLTTKRIAGTPSNKEYRSEDFEQLWEVVRLFAARASPSRLHQNVRDLGRRSIALG